MSTQRKKNHNSGMNSVNGDDYATKQRQMENNLMGSRNTTPAMVNYHQNGNTKDPYGPTNGIEEEQPGDDSLMNLIQSMTGKKGDKHLMPTSNVPAAASPYQVKKSPYLEGLKNELNGQQKESVNTQEGLFDLPTASQKSLMNTGLRGQQ
mmetsp:Transcript_10960/g.11082  ORF Transcript_10960/g.11082 Transcript_10960/m.11082 type:complete len:150 (-) Transcript_10960:256-705(-)